MHRFEMNISDELWDKIEDRRRSLGFKATVETIRFLLAVALLPAPEEDKTDA